MGPYQRTPKKVTRAIKYPGLGVRSVGPVGDFLEVALNIFFLIEAVSAPYPWSEPHRCQPSWDETDRALTLG